MFQYRFVQKFVSMFFLLALFFSVSLGNNSAGARSSSLELFSENEVEILILLEQQADTEETALEVRNAWHSTGNADQEKAAVRMEVVKALQDTATAEQYSLLRYLEREKGLGRVTEISSFFIVNLVYARVSEELVEIIARRPEVHSVWPNERFKLVEAEKELQASLSNSDLESNLEWNIKRIQAPQVWNIYGIDGSGVVVGIIDTGVDWGHKALRGSYRGCVPSNPSAPDHTYNWYDPYYDWPYPDDYHGHGTHCTGIVLGSVPTEGTRIGVAPGAQWIAARGLNDHGWGDSARLLSAMEYMLAPTDSNGNPNPAMAPDIVNNSWSAESVCNPIFLSAIQNWRSAEILPVFSAGNFGPEAGSIGLPANYEESFAVGATNEHDELPDFSSRGPGACGSFWKPDISAPGVQIRSAQSESPNRPRGYGHYSGTSMAAPHISGVAALLRAADSALTAVELEAIMTKTAVKLTSDCYPSSPNHGFGHGLIDAFAAVEFVGVLPLWPEELEDMLFIGEVGISTNFLFADRVGSGQKIDNALADDASDGKAFVKLSGQPLVNIWERQEAATQALVQLLTQLKGYWDCNGNWIDW